MKSLFKTHVVPATLVITIFASNFLLLSVPKLVQAADSKTACEGGVAIAVGTYVWEKIKNVAGVPAGTGQAEGNVVKIRENAAKFINDCVLKPLAQMMIVALIRNIGASVVKWVNTGFEGKPAFVTNFEGTLLDSADQAAGTFIEGDKDLGFLCSPFSFQIRIALALKYSKPFNEQIKCTLTEIGDNVNNFANNNGGAGWNNWLRVTTEPQNNVYGAFLIADSELAKRMANAVDKKEKRIALGSGFLDFETCDEYETQLEADTRASGVATKDPFGAAPVNLGTSDFSSGLGEPIYDFGNPPQIIGYSKAPAPLPTFDKASSAITGNKPQCKPGKMTTKTPGQVIASQLNSEFATGPIQRAVATEIDQVISATLNQLAQKAIQGANGLLGLSQKKQSNNVSYIDQYRATYYGQGGAANVQGTGAQSELDTYTVGSYDDVLSLQNDPTNSDIQNINEFTDTAAGTQIQAQNDQLNSTIAAYGEAVPERNAALGKVSTQSSVLNAATNGNDGVKQTSQYVKGAETSESEAGGWWEVDLGADKNIEKINIYPNTSPSAPNGGLGTFTVDVRSDAGNSTTYPGSSFSQNTNTGALTGTIGRMGRYVRITRQASETSCPDDYYGRTYSSSSSCIDQPHLAFAELEVMEKVELPSTAPTPGTTVNNGTPSTPVTDSTTATSTLSWNPQIVSNLRINGATGINQEMQLATVKSVSGITAEIALYDASGRNIPFSRVFSNFDIARGPSGGSWTSSQSIITPSTGTLRVGLSINQNSGFSFKITGSKQASAPTGNYSFVSQVIDSTGTVLENKTQRINFVVE